MNINKVTLAGCLTRNPELRYTPKGTAVCQCGVAVNRRWTTEGGEKKEEVTFIDVTFWGNTAEAVGQYFKKGNAIYLEGRLKMDSWDDKVTGQKRYKLSVNAELFQFVGSKAQDGPEGAEAGQATQKEERRRSDDAEKPAESSETSQEPEDDSVPF